MVWRADVLMAQRRPVDAAGMWTPAAILHDSEGQANRWYQRGISPYYLDDHHVFRNNIFPEYHFVPAKSVYALAGVSQLLCFDSRNLEPTAREGENKAVISKISIAKKFLRSLN